MKRYLSKFFYVLRGKEKQLLLLVFLFLLVSLLEALGVGLIGPFIAISSTSDLISKDPQISWIYTHLGFNSENQLLLLLGSIVVVIFYVKSLLSFSVQKYIFEFGFNQQGELCSRLMHAYLAAPYTFHLGRNTALLIQNIIKETDRFCNGVMMPILVSTSNIAVICALGLLLLKTDMIATVFILGIVIISFFLLHQFKDRMARWGKEGSQAQVEMIRVINHGLGGMKETRVIGCEAYFINQMREQSRKFALTTSAAVSFSTLPRYMIEAFFITFLIGFTFLFITFNPGDKQGLTSVLGTFGIASFRLLPAAGNLISAINGIRYSSYSLEQLYLDLKELEEIDAQKKLVSLHDSVINSLNEPIQGGSFTSFALDEIVYRYPNTSEVALDKVSLVVKKGQSIGLIGKSGAGKTTLVDVLLGLLVPESGDLRADNVSIYRDLRSWQNMIGYVPQSIFLIDDTLEKNIAFGVPEHLINQQRIDEAIKSAQLSDLIGQLPDGIKTAIGERGVRLSGGQRQRVGIARALYHEREILVLDEATSALDNETESLVSEAIKSLSGAKTLVIIAHRLSTIEHCDCIYLMEKGRVVQSGSYQEVVLKK